MISAVDKGSGLSAIIFIRFVRGNVILGAFRITPLPNNPNACEFEYLAYADPKVCQCSDAALVTNVIA